MWIDERGSEVLGLPECRRLLAVGAKERRHGHLSVPAGGAPSVLPVDYVVQGPDVIVRVGEGLFKRLRDQLVAFQVDGADRGARPDGSDRPWSVLVRGLATEEDESALGSNLPVASVSRPGRRLVRIRGDVVTGRRLGDAPRKGAGTAER